MNRDFFISRAGEDVDFAKKIDQVLRNAGYTTYMQDNDFGNAVFTSKVHEGLKMVDRGARLIALVSSHYLAKDTCTTEALHPLADDPSNSKERLIVFVIDDCHPDGSLKGVRHTRIGHLRNDFGALTKVVLKNISRPQASSRGSQRLLETAPAPNLVRADLLATNSQWTTKLSNVFPPEALGELIGGFGAFVIIGVVLVSIFYFFILPDLSKATSNLMELASDPKLPQTIGYMQACGIKAKSDPSPACKKFIEDIMIDDFHAAVEKHGAYSENVFEETLNYTLILATRGEIEKADQMVQRIIVMISKAPKKDEEEAAAALRMTAFFEELRKIIPEKDFLERLKDLGKKWPAVDR